MKPGEYCRVGLRKAGAFPVCCFVHWLGCPAWSKWFSYERGVMKRNEGSNERSGVRDTVAAVRNEPELQAAWQTCDSSPKGIAGAAIP